MTNSQKYVGKNVWVFYIMIFAFCWLVVGELVTLHQKAIYGFDPFSQEAPFAKPDNSKSKTKFDKGSKFDKFKDQFHFEALRKDESKTEVIVSEVGLEFNNTYSIFISQSGYPLIVLRGPPTC